MNYVENYIHDLYQHLHITSPHQLNPEYVARKLHIHLVYWDEISQATLYQDKPYILLDTFVAPYMWEEFCHELCHILQHSGNQLALPPPFVAYQETKADYFALHAAVPTFMLAQLLIPTDYAQTICIIQNTFHVSPTFARKRLDHYINNHSHPFTHSQIP